MKPVRDALILSDSGAAEIKRHTATGQALLLLGAPPLHARLASRCTWRALVNRVTRFFATCLAGTGVRLGMRLVLEYGGKVVEDHAHLDAPVGGIEYALHQQRAASVAPPEVILQVERVARRVDQRQAPAQPLLVAVEQLKARLSLGKRCSRVDSKTARAPSGCGADAKLCAPIGRLSGRLAQPDTTSAGKAIKPVLTPRSSVGICSLAIAAAL